MGLVVLTHGFGADAGFWGSTVETLSTDRRLASHEIKSWSYYTSKRPEVRGLRTISRLLSKRRKQSLEFLGEELWSNLRTWSEGHERVVLLGHSMGGLVTASALRAGYASPDPHDRRVVEAIAGAVCVATPFAGASDAKTLTRIYAAIGGNLHARELRPDSAVRRAIVAGFTNLWVRDEAFQFVLMRAASDEVVLPNELLSPFESDSYLTDVLEGGHSDCIADLVPGQLNLEKIVGCLGRILKKDGANGAAPANGTEVSPTELVAAAGQTTVRYELPDGMVIQWVGPDPGEARSFGETVLRELGGADDGEKG